MAKSEKDKRINSDLQNTTQNNGNAKRGVSPCLTIWPGDLDLWPITFKINRVPDSLSMYQVWSKSIDG
jgi:hypothetical protein